MKKQYIFTSESITEGHPDKIADQIVDAILDDYLSHDENARVACECMIANNIVHIAGQISSGYDADIESIVRAVIKEIGYNSEKIGLDYSTCKVMVTIANQSSDISQGVDNAEDEINSIGAGDQGMMFGYACDETDEYMPLPIALAHKLSKQLSQVRKSGKLLFLRPDGKTQVSVKYEDGIAKSIDTIVISAQHNEEVSRNDLKEALIHEVVEPIIPIELIRNDTKIYINPTGRFVIGGPIADVGLTGRKIIVDTYGGYAPHGGGAFSGKDATKVDRSATYMARYIAKNIVASGIAKRITVQVAYAIGRAEPVSIYVDTHGTSEYDNEVIIDLIKDNFDLCPEGIIQSLDLRTPIYRQVSNYGHFGRTELDLPWERLDKVNELKYQLINYNK